VNHAATGNKSGDNWDNAISELADALKWARERWGEDGSDAAWDAENPLQIWVAEGTYTPLYKIANTDEGEASTTENDKSFVLVPFVHLYGGFQGGETNLTARDWESNKTV